MVATDSLEKGRQRAKPEEVAATIESVGKVANQQIAMLQSGKMAAVSDAVGLDSVTRKLQNQILAAVFVTLFGSLAISAGRRP